MHYNHALTLKSTFWILFLSKRDLPCFFYEFDSSASDKYLWTWNPVHLLSLNNIKFCQHYEYHQGKGCPCSHYIWHCCHFASLLPLHIHMHTFTHMFYISFLLFPSTLSPVAAFSSAFNDPFEVWHFYYKNEIGRCLTPQISFSL